MTDIERYNYAFDPEGDDWAARLLRRLPPRGAVLELGPGPGAMTKVMVDRGYQVTVVENDPGALDALKSMGVEVIAGNLEEQGWVDQLQGRRFDAVLACDVLEHLRWPDQVLTALGHLTAPEGSLIISIPNVSYGGIIAGLMNGVFDYTHTGLLDRTHLRFFTRRGMEQTLLELGWAPRAWAPYRLPLERSEFASCWSALTDGQKQGLASGCVDFDVYEWMVVATPSVDGGAGALKEALAATQKARDDLHALALLHASEHASLLEHQKAFSEARSIIERQQFELKALRIEADYLQDEKTALQAELDERTGKKVVRPSWLRRLRMKIRGA